MNTEFLSILSPFMFISSLPQYDSKYSNNGNKDQTSYHTCSHTCRIKRQQVQQQVQQQVTLIKSLCIILVVIFSVMDRKVDCYLFSCLLSYKFIWYTNKHGNKNIEFIIYHLFIICYLLSYLHLLSYLLTPHVEKNMGVTGNATLVL